MSLDSDLRAGLSKAVDKLNDRRSLMQRFRKSRYEVMQFIGPAGPEFKVIYNEPKGKRGIIADISNDNEDGKNSERTHCLHGVISPDKRYDPIRDCVHGLSHEYGVQLSGCMRQSVFPIR